MTIIQVFQEIETKSELRRFEIYENLSIYTNARRNQKKMYKDEDSFENIETR